MRIYRHRIADELLKRKLLGKGAVLVQGPKWCGKTTTAKQVAKSLLDLGDAAELSSALETIQILPKKLLEGENPSVSSNFVSADFRKMRTDSFQKSRTTRFRKIRVVR